MRSDWQKWSMHPRVFLGVWSHYIPAARRARLDSFKICINHPLIAAFCIPKSRLVQLVNMVCSDWVASATMTGFQTSSPNTMYRASYIFDEGVTGGVTGEGRDESFHWYSLGTSLERRHLGPTYRRQVSKKQAQSHILFINTPEVPSPFSTRTASHASDASHPPCNQYSPAVENIDRLFNRNWSIVQFQNPGCLESCYRRSHYDAGVPI